MGKNEKTIEVKQTKTEIKMPKTPLTAKLAKEGNLLAVVDDLFEGAIFYAYCTFSEMKALSGKIYSQEFEGAAAQAYSFYGPLRGSVVSAGFVWVDSDRARRVDAIPSFMHEICHLADNIIEGACVDDRKGEVRAYLVERECRRILNAFFGIRAKMTLTAEDVLEILK